VAITSGKSSISALITGTMRSPSGTARAPPGQKSFLDIHEQQALFMR